MILIPTALVLWGLGILAVVACACLAIAAGDDERYTQWKAVLLVSPLWPWAAGVAVYRAVRSAVSR